MKKKGITLIELVAVIAIMSIVFGIIYNIFSSGNMVYNKGMQETQLVDSSRSVFLAIGEDIKKASSVTVPSEGTVVNVSGVGSGQSLIKISPLDDSSSFQYVLIANKLYRVIDSTGSITMIASNINSLSITGSDSANPTYIIDVNINYKGKSKNFTTTIASRNRGL